MRNCQTVRDRFWRNRSLNRFKPIGQGLKSRFFVEGRPRIISQGNHVLFGLNGHRKARLHPFVWAACDAVVCLPSEHVDAFGAMIA